MHDHGGRGGPARPPRRRWWPYLAALVAVLALALAVTACGGGGDKRDGVASLGDGKATSTTSPGGGKDSKQQMLAYARCMRQHGIDMPDPKFDAAGRAAMQMPSGVGPDDPKFKAAQQACQQYMPRGGGGRVEDVAAQPVQLIGRESEALQELQTVGQARCDQEAPVGWELPDEEAEGAAALIPRRR